MQYGVDISTYKRIGSNKDKNEASVQWEAIKYISMFVIGILLSRVVLTISKDIGLAPFGIAYLISLKKNNIKEDIICFLGVITGYATIWSGLDTIMVYVLVSLTVLVYNQVCRKLEIRNSDLISFVVIFLVTFLFNIAIYSKPIGVNIIISTVMLISIMPVKYIIGYSFNSIKEIDTNYFFESEEIISVGILICLLIAGFGDISILGVYLRSLIGITVIALFSYVGGSGIGAAIGIAMGFIIGITNGSIENLVTLYGLCGLMLGVFKDMGRIFSSLAYLVVYFIINVYASTLSFSGGIEVLVGLGIFLLIPKEIINFVEKEFNNDKKAQIINDAHLVGIKNEFVDRLNGLKSILSTLSVSVSNLGGNDILALNNKGSAMIENLADRVCFNCELKQKCWDRNLYSTYEGFSELINSCENNYISFPKNLENKCVKKMSLMKNAQEIVNNYAVNEALKTRLSEGRKLVANHINSISLTMGDMIRDFEKDINICAEIDKILKKAFNKERLNYKDVFCYLDKKGRMKIKILLDNSEGENYCYKRILPIINSLVKVPVSVSKDGYRIDPTTGECSIIIEETPKYKLTSYVSTRAKEGETQIGDSYSFNKNIDGTYLTIISDGMGSGPEASSESKLAVDLIEKFMESGFNYKTAIDTVNSIMAMKFNEDEKFTTMDLNLIDLYTGEAEFIKIGGVVSFIKRGAKIFAIKSNSLPFGILESLEINEERFKLKHGDIIISISDGVLDIDKNNAGSYSWLEEYLQYCEGNPSLLSRDILERATVLSGGKVKDDMTVLVSKIYASY